MKRFSSQNGFTLIELLIVIFLVAVLTTTAIRSYVNSTDTFKFLSSYKQVMASIKSTRSYAITNEETNGKIPKRYGVKIEAQKVTVFADDGTNSFVFDAGQGTPVIGADTIITPKTYDFADAPYTIEAFDSNKGTLALPIVLFYETGKADLTTKYNTLAPGGNLTLEKSDHKFLYLKFSETAGELLKYIVIFQISGLPEEYEEISQL